MCVLKIDAYSNIAISQSKTILNVVVEFIKIVVRGRFYFPLRERRLLLLLPPPPPPLHGIIHSETVVCSLLGRVMRSSLLTTPAVFVVRRDTLCSETDVRHWPKFVCRLFTNRRSSVPARYTRGRRTRKRG